jgi:hypothetical protein
MPSRDAFKPETAVTLSATEERELRLACESHWVDDVPAAFADLPRKGSKLKIRTKGSFPDSRSYTQTRANFGGNENHFQGCQRLLGGPYFAISGSDWRNKASHLFIAKLGSRARKKWWNSNLEVNGPPNTDKVVLRLDLHNEMWHAGGFDLCGHILAVTIECGPVAFAGFRGVTPPKCEPPRRSRILFVSVKQPERPRILASKLERMAHKATAAALLQIPGEGYVAAVLSSGKKGPTHRDKQIDFYRTDGNSISNGFQARSTYRVPNVLKWSDYQTINFVYERSGRIFLAGLAKNLADLFQVDLPAPGSPARLHFVARHNFDVDRSFAEFKAGAGIYSCDGTLGLYGVPQWRLQTGVLHLAEWAPPNQT